MEDLLRFTFGNDKLPTTTASFSILSGHTCPGAKLCKAMVGPGGKGLILGKDAEFLCMSASAERRMPNVYKSRLRNFERLKANMHQLDEFILRSVNNQLKRSTTHLRWHVAGDFFSPAYVQAVISTARQTPDLIHYWYTKSLKLFMEVDLPPNVKLTASYGGHYDCLIDEGHFPRNSRVVYSPEEAESLGLPIDRDDTHAYEGAAHSFCHLIHGNQPAGSKAMRAVTELRRRGITAHDKQPAKAAFA